MSLFSEVKCRRCDRRYSGLRGRCPYCGTRRSGKGKRAPTNENTTAKMVIGLLLLGILAAAVVFLIVMSNTDTQKEEEKKEDPVYSSDEGVVSVETSEPPASVEPSVEPSPSAPIISSVQIFCYSSEVGTSASDNYDYEFTISVGESVPLSARILPEDGEYSITWESDDESIVAVLSDGDVTALSEGNAVITLTVNDVVKTCLVRVV